MPELISEPGSRVIGPPPNIAGERGVDWELNENGAPVSVSGIWESDLAVNRWYKCDRPSRDQWALDLFREQLLKERLPYKDCVPDADMSVECNRVWHTKTLGPIVLRQSTMGSAAQRSGPATGYKACLPYFSREGDDLSAPEAAYGRINDRDPDLQHRMQRWAKEEPLSRAAEAAYAADHGPGGGASQVHCKKDEDGNECTLKRRRRKNEGGLDEDLFNRRGEEWKGYRDKTEGWIIEAITVRGPLLPGGARGNPVTILCVRAEFKCDPKRDEDKKKAGYITSPSQLPGETWEEFEKRLDRPPVVWDLGTVGASGTYRYSEPRDRSGGCFHGGGGVNCKCEGCGAKHAIARDATWSLAVATGGRARALGAFWQIAVVFDHLLHAAARVPRMSGPVRNREDTTASVGHDEN